MCGIDFFKHWFGFSSVFEKKLRFGSDIIIICYLCNRCVIIYSKYYSVTAILNELCIADFDIVVNKV